MAIDMHIKLNTPQSAIHTHNTNKYTKQPVVKKGSQTHNTLFKGQRSDLTIIRLKRLRLGSGAK